MIEQGESLIRRGHESILLRRQAEQRVIKGLNFRIAAEGCIMDFGTKIESVLNSSDQETSADVKTWETPRIQLVIEGNPAEIYLTSSVQNSPGVHRNTHAVVISSQGKEERLGVSYKSFTEIDMESLPSLEILEMGLDFIDELRLNYRMEGIEPNKPEFISPPHV